MPDCMSKPLKKASLNESVSSSLLRKTNIVTPGTRPGSLPTTPGGSRASSPSKGVVSRGLSPAHSRPSSPCRKSSNSNTSVLSFIAEIKTGRRM